MEDTGKELIFSKDGDCEACTCAKVMYKRKTRIINEENKSRRINIIKNTLISTFVMLKFFLIMLNQIDISSRDIKKINYIWPHKHKYEKELHFHGSYELIIWDVIVL